MFFDLCVAYADNEVFFEVASLIKTFHSYLLFQPKQISFEVTRLRHEVPPNNVTKSPNLVVDMRAKFFSYRQEIGVSTFASFLSL